MKRLAGVDRLDVRLRRIGNGQLADRPRQPRIFALQRTLRAVLTAAQPPAIVATNRIASMTRNFMIASKKGSGLFIRFPAKKSPDPFSEKSPGPFLN